MLHERRVSLENTLLSSGMEIKCGTGNSIIISHFVLPKTIYSLL